MFPIEFAERMQKMLGAEYEEFLASYDKQKSQALRVNTLKGSMEKFRQSAPFSLRPVLWETNGFYYEDGERPGKHPYHEAGVYYIQEASAQIPAAYLGVRPGEKVLDLCAAPGGKSTQLAALMQGQGILVCNEIHPARARILSENIERMGIGNAIVTNETPQALADMFVEYFDRIMVDAPCSGEGMFRKNEEAQEEWSMENVQLCAERQDEILECAAKMLRPGGRMVYSTCTFAPEENEGSVSRFLKKHEEFHIADTDKVSGMEGGRREWVQAPAEGLDKTIRLFPHKAEGEGHFAAVLEKEGQVAEDYKGYCRNGEQKGLSFQECREYAEFEKENMKIKLKGIMLKFGEQLYLVPPGTPSLKGIKVLRPGLHLGTIKKNRFEPSHALALFLKPTEAARCLELSGKTREAADFIAGMTRNAEGEKGWYLISVDGYSLGWGKLAGGIMKNHYPKGLRKNLL